MITPVILIAVILGVFVLYTIVGPTAFNLNRFMGRFRLYCPSHATFADLRLNAFGAALTSAYGKPAVDVRKCTLLNEGEICGQDCLEELDE
jgi:hypothetical protein